MPRRRQQFPTSIASFAGALVGFAFIALALVIVALSITGSITFWIGVVVIPALLAVAFFLIVAHARRHPTSASAGASKQGSAIP